MKLDKNVKAWTDVEDTIATFPQFLKGGYFIQLPQILPKATKVEITLTGNAIVYIALEEGERNGGFDQSRLGEGWKKEVEFIATGDNEVLSPVFSFSSRFHKEKKIILPPTTTDETVMLITVVPICTGTFFKIII